MQGPCVRRKPVSALECPCAWGCYQHSTGRCCVPDGYGDKLPKNCICSRQEGLHQGPQAQTGCGRGGMQARSVDEALCPTLAATATRRADCAPTQMSLTTGNKVFHVPTFLSATASFGYGSACALICSVSPPSAGRIILHEFAQGQRRRADQWFLPDVSAVSSAAGRDETQIPRPVQT